MWSKARVFFILVVIIVAAFGYSYGKNAWYFKRASKYAKEGKFALSQHELEKMTCLTPSSIEECNQVLEIYLKSSNIQKLEYMAEFCENKGFKDKNFTLYKSKAKELRGDLTGALEVIGAQVNSGSNEPEFHLTAAVLFTRLGKTPAAVAAYLKLFRSAGENLDYKFRALGGLIDLKASEQALSIANVLAGQAYNQPIPYLLLARAFLQLDNRESAKQIFDKGISLLPALDEKVQTQITQNFQDVIQAIKTPSPAASDGKNVKKP